KKIDYRIIPAGEIVKVGSFAVEFIRVTHSIPENCSVAVNTEHGYVLFTGDFKLDFTPVDGKLTDLKRFGEIGDEGVVLLLSDSTNVERKGWGPSERTVSEGLHKVMSTAPGRVLLTTFASNIHRMQQVYDVAKVTGRKVAVVGRSMERNIDICQSMGYLTIPNGVGINLDEAKTLPPNEVAILTTGSQGEMLSALVQMSKDDYGRLQIKEGDTLIYSARPIPGNEGPIWRTINRLFQLGCNVIYDSPWPIHVSGHAYQEELKMMINLTKPFYIAPVHGEPRHQFLYNQIAMDMGYPAHRVFTLEAGVPLEMDEKNARLGKAVHTGVVLIDNSGTPGVTQEILKDRFSIANDGVLILSIAVDTVNGEIVGDPTILTRGFHGAPGMIERAQDIMTDAISSLKKEEIKDLDRIRNDATTIVKKFMAKSGKLRPLIVAAVIEV
ncbi:MAG: ribonuclease J, partial [Armatimonadota bacterium]